jgi:pimeloyl-ACP methyl ester carboxylesterase
VSYLTFGVPVIVAGLFLSTIGVTAIALIFGGGHGHRRGSRGRDAARDRATHGPTLLLVAGYPQTWYAWDDILPELAEHYTVVAPDLPGSSGSDAPAGTSAYTKKAMAGDLYQLLAKLGLDKNVRVVGHDIGTMVAYSYAAAHPNDVTKLVLSEAPIPRSEHLLLSGPHRERARAVVVRPVQRVQRPGREPDGGKGKGLGHAIQADP